MGQLKIECVMTGTTAGPFDETVRATSPLGPCYIVTDGWEPVACFGVIKSAWGGVAEIWMDRTDWAERNPKRFHRAAIMVIREVCQQLKLRRLQASVPASYLTGCDWLKRIGFKSEGEMLRFGPDGSTYIRYALFPEEVSWAFQH